MREFPGQIRLVLFNYPYKYRDFSFLAAEALLAAGDQGKYWEMHDLLIERSPKLDRESLLAGAKELGLDMGPFTGDLDTLKHRSQIEADIKLAEKLDLFNTPTFYINGRQVIGNRPYKYFNKIIIEEIQNAQK